MQIANVSWEACEAGTAAASECLVWRPPRFVDNCSPQAQGASSFGVKVLAHELICANCTEVPAFCYETATPGGRPVSAME